MSAATSIESKNSGRAIDTHEKSVLWLGGSEPPLPLVSHLRSRGLNLLAGAGAGAGSPIARLMFVESVASPAARAANVKGRRVAVMHPDPGSADALAQALRSRGAEVVALSLDPHALHRVEGFDPDAVVMEMTDFYGSCWEIVRALWQHPRLRFAPILLASPENVTSYAQGTPDVPSLCLAVQGVSESYAQLRDTCEKNAECTADLRALGPARVLRALTESQRAFRVQVSCSAASFEIDIAEGIIVGAQARALNAENDLYLGVHALALLMQQTRGQVTARLASHPAVTNVMAPLDTALHAAREAPPKPAAEGDVALPLPAALPRSTEAAAQPFKPAKPEPLRSNNVSLPSTRRTVQGLPPPSRPSRANNTGRLIAVVPRDAETEPATLPAPPPHTTQTRQAEPADAAGQAGAAVGAQPAANHALNALSAQAAAAPAARAPLDLSIFDTDEAAPTIPDAAVDDNPDANAFDVAPTTHKAPAVEPTDSAPGAIVVWRARLISHAQRYGDQALAAFSSLRDYLRQQPRKRLLAVGGGTAGLLLCAVILTTLMTRGTEAPAGPKPPPLASSPGAAQVPASSAPSADTAPVEPARAVLVLPTTPAESGELDDDADDTLDGQSESRKASHLVSQGHSFRKRKLYPSAKARYQEALLLLPNYPRALVGLAQVATAQGQHRDAIAFAQKLVQIRPTSASNQMLLGDTYSSANMPREAREAYDRAARAGSSAAKARLKAMR